MSRRRKVILSEDDSKAIKFAEDLMPRLPQLIGIFPRVPGKLVQDAILLTGYLRFVVDAARDGRVDGPGVTKNKIGSLVAPWPILRRLWEAEFPEDRGRPDLYGLDRYQGIMYAARLALEQFGELQGDGATEFGQKLQLTVREAAVGASSAESVRELMRQRQETRSLLEEVYPPARNPESFGGGGKLQGG